MQTMVKHLVFPKFNQIFFCLLDVVGHKIGIGQPDVDVKMPIAEDLGFHLMTDWWCEVTGNPFQDIILKHAREKIGSGRPSAFDCTASEVNSLCGDAVDVFLRRGSGHLLVSHEVTGCSLCAASASIMSEVLATLSDDDGVALMRRFLVAFPKGEVIASSGEGIEALFDLKRFPARERCVMLPWLALKKCVASEH